MTTPRPPRLSAGVVVVRCEAGAYRYLLLRAYRYWDFPKGIVEVAESARDAAQREVREETGLCDLEFVRGEQYVETEPYGTGKIARYYVALSSTRDVTLATNPALGRPEHHEYRWVDYEDACRLLGPRVRAVLDWAHDLLGESC